MDAYGGDLLEGTYDEWAIETRERLRDRYLDALERSWGSWRRARGRRAIRCAERLVRHDPLREDGHRALMRLHDARGERAQALRTYHAYAAALQRELDVSRRLQCARRTRPCSLDADVISASTQRERFASPGPRWLVGHERAQLPRSGARPATAGRSWCS